MQVNKYDNHALPKKTAFETIRSYKKGHALRGGNIDRKEPNNVMRRTKVSQIAD